MDREYSAEDRRMAGLMGLKGDPDALELARRLRGLNASSDIQRWRARRALREMVEDVLPIPKRDVA